MDPKLAARLLPFVTNPEFMEALEDYRASRSEAVRTELTYDVDQNQTNRLRGRFHELELLRELRDTVRNTLKRST